MVGIIATLVLSLVTFFGASLYPVSAVQQQQERLLHRLRVAGPEVEPIVITDIKVNGQSVSFDKKFGADDDWVKSLSFSVTNRSDKLILHVSLWFRFPRPKGSTVGVSISHMSYGNDELLARRPTSQERLIGLAPGESADIHFTPGEAGYLPIFLSATGYSSNIEKVDFEIRSVILEDDTMWIDGESFQRDDNDPSARHRAKSSDSRRPDK
jgi:hypothetical protein